MQALLGARSGDVAGHHASLPWQACMSLNSTFSFLHCSFVLRIDNDGPERRSCSACSTVSEGGRERAARLDRGSALSSVGNSRPEWVENFRQQTDRVTEW
jgi:hypothetical protein